MGFFVFGVIHSWLNKNDKIFAKGILNPLSFDHSKPEATRSRDYSIV